MAANWEAPEATGRVEERASEHTQIQRVAPARTIPVERLQYHLLSPRVTCQPLVEAAYELWRDVWQTTFLEVDGVAELRSDEFTRQDEIGVLTAGTACISVTALRWLDLSTARSREDSYFKPWPTDALQVLGRGVVGVSSNAVVHPDWRGTLLAPPENCAAKPVRLVYAAVGLTIQRFFESPAHCSVAVTRNDRRMDRICQSLGASSLARISLHGVDADVMRFPRCCVRQVEPALDTLWLRRLGAQELPPVAQRT
ncbi:MAG: hypothetical protein RL685_6538 [Pseudomonadota bacterium]|jgi:hypothetical protein